jgi:hypothetical protein
LLLVVVVLLELLSRDDTPSTDRVLKWPLGDYGKMMNEPSLSSYMLIEPHHYRHWNHGICDHVVNRHLCQESITAAHRNDREQR